MDFLAVDVETATSDFGSICQLGVAFFVAGECVRVERRMIDPETEFSFWNTKVHGITRAHIEGAPLWPEVFPELHDWAAGRAILSHTYFDRTAFAKACARYGLTMFPYMKWTDSCQAARKAWPQMPNHKLPSLAAHFGLTYQAHDAADDARVAGEVYLRTLKARTVR